jgi:hypothetical protein
MGMLKMLSPAFFGVHTSDETVLTVRVLLALFRVELTGLTGDTLGDDFGVFINQDGHAYSFSLRL